MEVENRTAEESCNPENGSHCCGFMKCGVVIRLVD